MHTEALFGIETQALTLSAEARDIKIVTIIEDWLISISSLEYECPTRLGKSELVAMLMYEAKE